MPGDSTAAERLGRSTATFLVAAAIFGVFAMMIEACSGAAADSVGHGPWRSLSIEIPATSTGGEAIELSGLVCRPKGDAPVRVVIINHGSPPSASQRPHESLAACDDEAPRWFLERGYVVVQALRRGYGSTGGRWAEGYGGCRTADYYDAGLETARDIAAIVHAARALPFARPDGLIVIGQSAGGWGTLAYSSQPHPGVAAIIAMAPGRGGHHDSEPFSNCQPDRLVVTAARYGASSRDGLLWMNARNDTYFEPGLVLAMQNAFKAAGGILTAAHVGPFANEGHHLFFGNGGSSVWGPIVEAYLETRHAPPA